MKKLIQQELGHNMEIIKENIKKKYEEIVIEENLLPIKVTDFYLEKIKEEIAAVGTGGPLYRSVLPLSERWELRSSHETRDYVEEYKHMPVDGVDYIIQKYKDRVLFIATDVCFSHCQYCFRTYNLSKFQNGNLKSTIIEKTRTLINYLSGHAEIKEVIISGGDPLSIGFENLEYVFKSLSKWNIRLHTRAIVYQPTVFTNDIIKLLKQFNVRLVFHISHPYEICKVVENKIREIGRVGVHMYAQFPLLRGINDHYLVLEKLLEKMDELHIRPISIFISDPISYSANFRISFERIANIMDDLNWNTPSWINSVRFTMDTTIGKVRRENIVRQENNKITFLREGKEVEYFDLDKEIDKKSDIRKLLWKN